MARPRLICTFLAVLYINYVTPQGRFTSPCPRLFVYDVKSNEPNRWFGIITVLSDTDLKGIWMRLILDRPAIQLGNWLGEVVTTDNKEFLIKDRNFALKAQTPHSVRFYIKYDPADPVPQLLSIRLNAKTVCPEVTTTEGPVFIAELQTSGSSGAQLPTPNPVQATTSASETSGGFNPNPGTSGEDDRFYPGDFYNLFNRPIDGYDTSSDCGTVIVKPKSQTTSGQAIKEGEFPWHAALYYVKGIDLTYLCAAALISKDYVITVAHCVTRRHSQKPLNPDSLVIYLGKHYLKRFTNAGIQDTQAGSIIPHPKYNPLTLSNDIALVKFTQSAEITDYVRPICLWQESLDLNSIVNKQGNVVGWGFDANGKISEQLTEGKMPVVSSETCTFSFPDLKSRFSSSTTYCAGYPNNTHVCSGDSGGGMAFPKTNSSPRNPVWQLRGLVTLSAALQNQFKCDASHYVVFTDSAKYLDWIKQTMATR